MQWSDLVVPGAKGTQATSLALIPLFDLINHLPTLTEHSSNYDFNEKELTLHAPKDFAEKEEVDIILMPSKKADRNVVWRQTEHGASNESRLLCPIESLL